MGKKQKQPKRKSYYRSASHGHHWKNDDVLDMVEYIKTAIGNDEDKEQIISEVAEKWGFSRITIRKYLFRIAEKYFGG